MSILHNKLLWKSIKIFITIFVVIIIFISIDIFSFLHTLRTCHISWILFGIFIFALISGLGALRLQLLLFGQRIHIKYFRILVLHVIGLYFNNFMLGQTGGDICKAYYLSKAVDDKKTEAVSTIFIDRMFGMFVLACIALVTAAYKSQDPLFKEYLAVSLIIFLVLVSGVLLMWNKRFLRKIPFLAFFAKRLPFQETLHTIYNSFVLYQHQYSLLVVPFFISILIHVLNIGVHFIAALSLDVHTPFIFFLLFVPIVSLLTSLPISVGGLGIGEAAYITLFGMVGVPAEKAVVISLLYRFIVICVSVVGGYMYLFCPGAYTKTETVGIA